MSDIQNNTPPPEVMAYLKGIRAALPEGTTVCLFYQTPDTKTSILTDGCLHCVARLMALASDRCIAEPDMLVPVEDTPAGSRH